MNKSDYLPLKVYGSKISYFTGKLENYLRYKEIPYEHIPLGALKIQAEIRKKIGVIQLPNIELANGNWMTDTTPMIQWFETEFPDGPVIPSDPEQAFFSLLLEDYADEWLWRPAMHYRWHYNQDAYSFSRAIVDELFGFFRLFPKCIKRFLIRIRQRTGFTVGDGVHEGNIQEIEATYLNTLENLQAIFEKRPFFWATNPAWPISVFQAPCSGILASTQQPLPLCVKPHLLSTNGQRVCGMHVTAELRDDGKKEFPTIGVLFWMMSDWPIFPISASMWMPGKAERKDSIPR